MKVRHWAAIVVISAILVFVFSRIGADRRYSAIDFGIFYCAGAAVDRGQNPYSLEPLRTCEHEIWPATYLRGGYAEPAALPGYALVPFAILAKLPFGIAKLLWLILSCLGFGIAVAAGARLSKLSPIAIFALLFVPVVSLSITVGQLGPFIIAPLLVAAYLLRRGKDEAAAVVALFTAIEPHVAVPALAALFVLVPRSRVIVAAGAAFFAALHIAVLHPANAVAYFTQVLAAMSRAERAAADQYGTFWLLHTMGLPAAYAGILTSALYAAGVVAAIVIARRAVRCGNYDRAMLVALPAALVLLVTPYLHDVQLCAGLAAPLAALGTNPHDRRWIAAAAVLAIPWYGALHSAGLALKAVLGAAVFIGLADREHLTAPIAAAVGGFALLFVLHRLPVHAATVVDPPFVTSTVLAAQSWEAFLRSNPSLQSTGAGIVASKLPSWIALVSMAVLATGKRSRVR